MIYPRMAVVGCGLIGSSVILAARAAGVVGEVAVADSNPAHRARILELGYADLVTADIAQAVSGADLVVLAVPVLAMGEAAKAAAGALKPGATVTDVGSVKGSVAEALAAALPEGVFIVPGHPIAGTEQSGPDAGFAELFQNRWTILTPSPRQDKPYLAARGLIVRGVKGYGLPNHLRFTIGLEEHNRAVVDALTEFLKA